ncbi:MAG: SRPBCC domain-containing protein [Saprospiraceae bacterium]|nr:SRPBCC domain-containing protein [Saprospiraceae bacterium]
MQNRFESIYTTEIPVDLKKVWDGLTNSSLVKQYFFDTDMITDWIPGNPIIFRGAWEGKSYEDKGIVLEYKPLEKLSYSYLSNWSGKEDLPENYLKVTYEVWPVTLGTKITITQTNYDADTAKHSESNWELLITSMAKLLAAD